MRSFPHTSQIIKKEGESPCETPKFSRLTTSRPVRRRSTTSSPPIRAIITQRKSTPARMSDWNESADCTKIGSSRKLGGRAAWGRVCGRAKLLAGTLRCLHLCWRLPWELSPAKQLGRCPKPHKGRCPLTLQGADEKGRSPPLDSFSRLSCLRFHAPSACSFLVLRLSPCLLPQLSVKNPTKIARTRFIPRAGFAVPGIRYPTEPSVASSSIGTITTSTTPLSSSGMSR